MTDKLKQKIKDEVEKLPKEVKGAIAAAGWENITEEIGKKYLLNTIELNDLQVQTLLILIGLRDAEFYETRLESEVGLTKDSAEKIATEVSEQIFEPIVKNVEENIKKSLVGKNTTAVQNVDFILSGGNYGAFLENRDAKNSSDDETGTKLIGSSNIIETKNKLVN